MASDLAKSLARWTDKADLRGRTKAPTSVLRTATSPSQVDGEERVCSSDRGWTNRSGKHPVAPAQAGAYRVSRFIQTSDGLSLKA
jgi:hypothetical protein